MMIMMMMMMIAMMTMMIVTMILMMIMMMLIIMIMQMKVTMIMMLIIIMRNSQKSMTASIQACLPTAHYEIRTFMLPVDSGFASQLKNLQKVHKHDDNGNDDDYPSYSRFFSSNPQLLRLFRSPTTGIRTPVLTWCDSISAPSSPPSTASFIWTMMLLV